MSDWTGARLRSELAVELKARAELAGDSFQSYLNLFVEEALRRPSIESPHAIHVPIGRTEDARSQFLRANNDSRRSVVFVYRDFAGRLMVLAGRITAVSTTWLKLQPPGCPEVAIALDEIVAWQEYDAGNIGELWGIVPAWIYAGAVVHHWTPNATAFVNAARHG